MKRRCPRSPASDITDSQNRTIMGWSSGWYSRKELVEHLTNLQIAPTKDGRERKWIVAKKVFRGNNLWAIMETWVDGVLENKFIVLFMMKRFGTNCWGYKDVEETCGPVYYNCPVNWFDEVPDPGSHATAWREKVRKANDKIKSLHNGQTIKFDWDVRFSDGMITRELTVVKHHRRTLFRRPDGVLCRLSKQLQQSANIA